MKILILKPSSLGDVVQALPVLRLIKAHLPQSQVYWWIDAGLEPLLAGDPQLAGIIPFQRKRWTNPTRFPEIFRSIRELRAQRFDWVIDLQCLARSGTFAWLTNGALTVGLDEPREGARGFYDRVARRASFHTHAVDWYLSVLPFLGVPVHNSFVWLPERSDVQARLRAKWPLSDARWISLQPGARWLNKRWPAEYYAELVRTLAAQQPEYRFAILGSAEDAELGKKISAGLSPKKVLDLTGQLSLTEMVEWLRASSLMVTNDTGPMHVAAALRIPVVAMFGPTEPRRTGPYGQVPLTLRSNLPCVPCLKERCTYHSQMQCLRDISPAMVAAAVRNRLAGFPSENAKLALESPVSSPTVV